MTNLQPVPSNPDYYHHDPKGRITMHYLRDYHNDTVSRLSADEEADDYDPDAGILYDAAVDTAIDVLAYIGVGPDESGQFPHDRAGASMDEDVQTLLTLAIARCDGLGEFLADAVRVGVTPAMVEPQPPTRKPSGIEYVLLRAFNLTPGATFVDDDHSGTDWTVMHMSRDDSTELVHVWCHDNGDYSGNVSQRSFVFHYCDRVRLVGITVNPTDLYDNDCGN